MAGSYMNAKKGMKSGKSGSTGSTSAMKGSKGKPGMHGAMAGSKSTSYHGAMSRKGK